MQASQETVETRIRFNDLVAFRGPDGLTRAVATAARREHTTSAEFLRRLVIGRLREVGVPIVPAGQDRRVA